MIVEGSVNAVLSQQFIQQLPPSTQHKSLILVNARIHHALSMSESWIADNTGDDHEEDDTVGRHRPAQTTVESHRVVFCGLEEASFVIFFPKVQFCVS